MKIAFLTTDEPFYLPSLFKTIFEKLALHHAFLGIIVPPVYKGSTKFSLAIRYARTFGLYEALRLTAKLIVYRILDILPMQIGRGRYSLTGAFEANRIPYIYVSDVNSKETLQRIKNYGIDLLISVSCPQIFKSELINIAPRGCLNLHGAILPKYRGVMPSFWMLANREKEGGLTLFYVNEKIDAGDVLIQEKYTIDSDESLDSLIKKSKSIGAQMIIDAIRKIDDGTTGSYPLQKEGGSYFGWPSREDVLKFKGNGKKFR
jgi:methionyl-tRNA formyltransferase